MLPRKFKGYERVLGAPTDWDEKKHGSCGGLPVLIHEGVTHSCWRFSWRERVRVLFGADIHMILLGRQPPIKLVVMKVGAAT